VTKYAVEKQGDAHDMSEAERHARETASGVFLEGNPFADSMDCWEDGFIQGWHIHAERIASRRSVRVTDAMVEAAALVIYGGTAMGWRTLSSGWQTHYLITARAALEYAEKAR